MRAEKRKKTKKSKFECTHTTREPPAQKNRKKFERALLCCAPKNRLIAKRCFVHSRATFWYVYRRVLAARRSCRSPAAATACSARSAQCNDTAHAAVCVCWCSAFGSVLPHSAVRCAHAQQHTRMTHSNARARAPSRRSPAQRAVRRAPCAAFAFDFFFSLLCVVSLSCSFGPAAAVQRAAPRRAYAALVTPRATYDSLTVGRGEFIVDLEARSGELGSVCKQSVPDPSRAGSRAGANNPGNRSVKKRGGTSGRW